MPTQEETYRSHAGEYEALIACEDYQGNILPALQDIHPLAGLEVLDLGAGTGRLARLLAPLVHRALAFDLSPHMLGIARDRLARGSRSNWLAAAADHRLLPLPAASADLVVSGWSVSYLSVWDPANGRVALDLWLAEMERVLKPGGEVVLLESLGTGNREPSPLEHLSDFYAWLDDSGFAGSWIRTDYRFDSRQQAEALCGFFFGADMKANLGREEGWILPECTGLWRRAF
jgi:ubiquinone/menaquinone biosynthesis C-methylase UbiE